MIVTVPDLFETCLVGCNNSHVSCSICNLYIMSLRSLSSSATVES